MFTTLKIINLSENDFYDVTIPEYPEYPEYQDYSYLTTNRKFQPLTQHIAKSTLDDDNTRYFETKADMIDCLTSIIKQPLIAKLIHHFWKQQQKPFRINLAINLAKFIHQDRLNLQFIYNKEKQPLRYVMVVLDIIGFDTEKHELLGAVFTFFAIPKIIDKAALIAEVSNEKETHIYYQLESHSLKIVSIPQIKITNLTESGFNETATPLIPEISPLTANRKFQHVTKHIAELKSTLEENTSYFDTTEDTIVCLNSIIEQPLIVELIQQFWEKQQQPFRISLSIDLSLFIHEHKLQLEYQYNSQKKPLKYVMVILDITDFNESTNELQGAVHTIFALPKINDKAVLIAEVSSKANTDSYFYQIEGGSLIKARKFVNNAASRDLSNYNIYSPHSHFFHQRASKPTCILFSNIAELNKAFALQEQQYRKLLEIIAIHQSLLSRISGQSEELTITTTESIKNLHKFLGDKRNELRKELVDFFDINYGAYLTEPYVQDLISKIEASGTKGKTLTITLKSLSIEIKDKADFLKLLKQVSKDELKISLLSKIETTRLYSNYKLINEIYGSFSSYQKAASKYQSISQSDERATSGLKTALVQIYSKPYTEIPTTKNSPTLVQGSVTDYRFDFRPSLSLIMEAPIPNVIYVCLTANDLSYFIKGMTEAKTLKISVDKKLLQKKFQNNTDMTAVLSKILNKISPSHLLHISLKSKSEMSPEKAPTSEQMPPAEEVSMIKGSPLIEKSCDSSDISVSSEILPSEQMLPDEKISITESSPLIEKSCDSSDISPEMPASMKELIEIKANLNADSLEKTSIDLLNHIKTNSELYELTEQMDFIYFKDEINKMVTSITFAFNEAYLLLNDAENCAECLEQLTSKNFEHLKIGNTEFGCLPDFVNDFTLMDYKKLFELLVEIETFCTFFETYRLKISPSESQTNPNLKSFEDILISIVIDIRELRLRKSDYPYAFSLPIEHQSTDLFNLELIIENLQYKQSFYHTFLSLNREKQLDLVSLKSYLNLETEYITAYEKKYIPSYLLKESLKLLSKCANSEEIVDNAPETNSEEIASSTQEQIAPAEKPSSPPF